MMHTLDNNVRPLRRNTCNDIFPCGNVTNVIDQEYRLADKEN
jgi:hypothetical protein